MLIKKTKPEWQRGKLNGVGGKIEAGETPHQAMLREWKEETGDGFDHVWEKFLRLSLPNSHEPTEVHFFRAFSSATTAHTTTDEVIIIRAVSEVFQHWNVIPNLRWIIPFALNRETGMVIQ